MREYGKIRINNENPYSRNFTQCPFLSYDNHVVSTLSKLSISKVCGMRYDFHLPILLIDLNLAVSSNPKKLKLK